MKQLSLLLFLFSLTVGSLWADELSHFYFAYGSNLSYDFLKERLKDGEWIDDMHKAGTLQGPAPVDFGSYVLRDFEFAYNLDVESFGDSGTAANITSKKGA